MSLVPRRREGWSLHGRCFRLKVRELRLGQLSHARSLESISLCVGREPVLFFAWRSETERRLVGRDEVTVRNETFHAFVEDVSSRCRFAFEVARANVGLKASGAAMFMNFFVRIGTLHLVSSDNYVQFFCPRVKA